MNEATIRFEIRNMLRYHYNLWPDHWPDIVGSKRPGRPDLIVMNPRGPGFYIEVKALYYKRSKSFAFSLIEDSQRRWLSTWEEVRHNGSWLALGTIGTPSREIFVIPWITWLRIEDEVKVCQDSLPYIAGKGFAKYLQDNKLDFRLLQPYRLLRVPVIERVGRDPGWRFQQEAIWL